MNDLLKDNHTGTSLINYMGPRLEKYCSKFSETTYFIFNSVLITNDPILNREVNKFNRFIFDLSMRIDDNFWFLDTHQVLLDSKLNRNNILRDGIHLTRSAGSLLEVFIIQTVTSLLNNSMMSWPLRPHFTDLAQRRRGQPVVWH